MKKERTWFLLVAAVAVAGLLVLSVNSFNLDFNTDLSGQAISTINTIGTDVGQWKQTTPPVKKACRDSDGGKNYDVRGTASGPTRPYDHFDKEEDRCMVTQDGEKLYEFYCTRKGKMERQNVDCPEGCYAGRCTTYGDLVVKQMDMSILVTGGEKDTAALDILIANTGGDEATMTVFRSEAWWDNHPDSPPPAHQYDALVATQAYTKMQPQNEHLFSVSFDIDHSWVEDAEIGDEIVFKFTINTDSDYPEANKANNVVERNFILTSKSDTYLTFK